jgi:hypothetical protein
MKEKKKLMAQTTAKPLSGPVLSLPHVVDSGKAPPSRVWSKGGAGVWRGEVGPGTKENPLRLTFRVREGVGMRWWSGMKKYVPKNNKNVC